MKNVLVLTFVVLSSMSAQASDVATCKVDLNGSTVSVHQENSAELEGVYSYRTHGRDEFYDLKYSFVTTSQPATKKLVVDLVGAENEFSAKMHQKNVSDFSAEVSLMDHEGQTIRVHCQID